MVRPVKGWLLSLAAVGMLLASTRPVSADSLAPAGVYPVVQLDNLGLAYGATTGQLTVNGFARTIALNGSKSYGFDGGIGLLELSVMLDDTGALKPNTGTFSLTGLPTGMADASGRLLSGEITKFSYNGLIGPSGPVFDFVLKITDGDLQHEFGPQAAMAFAPWPDPSIPSDLFFDGTFKSDIFNVSAGVASIYPVQAPEPGSLAAMASLLTVGIAVAGRRLLSRKRA